MNVIPQRVSSIFGLSYVSMLDFKKQSESLS